MLLTLDALPVASSGDSGLIDRCRQGEAAAWRELYEQNFELGWRTARRLGANEAEVDDVVHDAFEIVFRKMADFTTGRFSTWLYRIIANVVAARLERRSLRTMLLSLWGGREEWAASPEGEVDARQRLSRLEGVLRAMSRPKREVFALHELEGLSHEEIAELTGTKVETVRSRLHSAKRDFERLARKRRLMP